MTTTYSQSMREEVLTAIFTSAARVSVLRLFMLDPRRPYYQRQIEGATGLPIRAVQRELERLVAAGLLYRRMEGNRAYHQVDMDHALFPELRSMIIKTATAADRLRGHVALDENVRLAFLCEDEGRALVVVSDDRLWSNPADCPFVLDVLTSAAFTRAVGKRTDYLEPFLTRGVDLLGRREDVVWRRIEAAGYTVQRGIGVA